MPPHNSREREAVPSLTDPRLGDMFDYVFSRSSPMIEGSDPLLVGASLLRFHPVEAAMVLTDGARPVHTDSKVAFLSGYSILAHLLKKDPMGSYKSLFEPCQGSALLLDTVNVSQRLATLLQLFKLTRFGFTAIADGKSLSVLGLSDAMTLYLDGTIATDLLVQDVASKPIVVDKGETLKDALRLMFDKRVRRLLIKGESTFVSDREVISHLFSPEKLEATRANPPTMLEGRIVDVGPTNAEVIDDDTPLKEASEVLSKAQGSMLLCEHGIVSPWDLVIKPFSMGHLATSSR